MKSLLRVAPIAIMIGLVVPAMHPTIASASPVDQARERVEQVVDELERLEERTLQISEEYVEALDAQSTLADEITELEADIAAKEAELGVLRSDLGEMAIRSFVGSGGTPLGPLFEDSADINDVLHRDELARVALSAGDVTTDELDAFVSDLEDDRAEVDAKRREAEQLAVSLVAAQEETEALKAEYQQARIQAEADLGQAIQEEEARRAAAALAALQAQIAAQEAENAAAAAAASASNRSAASSNSNGSNSNGSSSNSNSNGSSSGNSGGGGATAPAANSGGGGGTSSNTNSGGSSTPAPSAPAPAPTPPPAPSAPPVSSLASVAVSAAMGQRGVPYRYATASPGVSFDCSGLTKYAWGRAGVSLPHQSRQQYASIPHVSKDAARPGDLIFYYSPISHVGIYIGGGQLVHAPATGDVVKVATVRWGKVTGVGRPG